MKQIVDHCQTFYDEGGFGGVKKNTMSSCGACGSGQQTCSYCEPERMCPACRKGDHKYHQHEWLKKGRVQKCACSKCSN